MMAGKRLKDVGHSHQHFIEHAADVPGQHTDQHPNGTAMPRIRTAMPSEIRAPEMTRLNRSRPSSSVPNGCESDGPISRLRVRLDRVVGREGWPEQRQEEEESDDPQRDDVERILTGKSGAGSSAAPIGFVGRVAGQQ